MVYEGGGMMNSRCLRKVQEYLTINKDGEKTTDCGYRIPLYQSFL